MEYVNCLSCGKYIGGKYIKFDKLVKEYRKKQNIDDTIIIYSTTTPEQLEKFTTKDGKTPEAKAMDELGVYRYCCRRHFISRTASNLVKNY